MNKPVLFSSAIRAAPTAMAMAAWAGKKGPNLSGLRTNPAWPPEKIKEQILNGGQKMPPFSDSMTDAEIAQVIAYLRAKHRPVPPRVAAGTPAQ